MKMQFGFPLLVVKLGLLSLFTDMSSEMIFPLLPMFLASLPGGGPFALGIVEGIAESTSSFFKLVSGLWSDKLKKRAPFVMSGYGIASVVRPFIAFARIWPVVLVLRFFDRIGKGLRSSPRDAMIADSTPVERRGEAFGFQRIMDHTGAVAGPVIVFLLMNFGGMSIRQVILFSAVPSVIVLVILATLREPSQPPAPQVKIPPTQEKHELPRNYWMLLTAMFVFTLGNSTDAFLLLRLSNVGIATEYVALLWGFHHILKILGAWVGGKYSDRAGRKPLMFIGLGLYALIYVAFGVVNSWLLLTGVFIIYGASIGILEPTERAWISELAGAEKRGAAFGYYHAAIGFGALPASVLFGLLWKEFGQMTAFLTGAGFAIVSAVIVGFIYPKADQRLVDY
jgi:MFS family permease